ncbi:MAG: DoxX family membrane protein [SAR202 cluster bacterium]|nr:DoxX family membrane protein [SAR202 cluster bacterium]
MGWLSRLGGNLTPPEEFRDPPLARRLFGDPTWSWVWLVVRVYLGYEWIQAGWHKVTDPRWMATGEAVKGFWTRAVAVPDAPARPPITYDWYRGFIEALLEGGHYVWFAKLVAVSEVVIGVALVAGALVGISAFAGAFMNWNFMMAGTASTNPVMFAISMLLIMAWKTAGWWGLDRWLLPMLGTPWQAGGLFRRGGGSNGGGQQTAASTVPHRAEGGGGGGG